MRLSRTAFLGLALALVAPVAEAAQGPKEASLDLLLAKQKRLLEYDSDFLDFEKSSGPGHELDVVVELEETAGKAFDRVDAAISLLELYDLLSCKEDRSRARIYIRKKLAHHSEFLGLAIKHVNQNISATAKPGVAAEAARMRDDLRGVVSILDSIELP